MGCCALQNKSDGNSGSALPPNPGDGTSPSGNANEEISVHVMFNGQAH